MRALQRQGQADRALLVRRAETSEARVKELEQELAAAQTLLAEDKQAHKLAEEKQQKTAEDLKELQKTDKRFQKDCGKAAQKAVDSFLKVLMRVGDETEPPTQDVSVPDSLEWLSSGLDTLGDLLDLGRAGVFGHRSDPCPGQVSKGYRLRPCQSRGGWGDSVVLGDRPRSSCHVDCLL